MLNMKQARLQQLQSDSSSSQASYGYERIIHSQLQDEYEYQEQAEVTINLVSAGCTRHHKS
jgi:hypothetical protein